MFKDVFKNILLILVKTPILVIYLTGLDLSDQVNLEHNKGRTEVKCQGNQANRSHCIHIVRKHGKRKNSKGAPFPNSLGG
jgi:hypothetical protein